MSHFLRNHVFSRIVCILLLILAPTFLAGCGLFRSRSQDSEPKLVFGGGDTGDRRPYEFIWADRKPTHDPLVDFQGLMGWHVEVYGSLQAQFERSRDLRLFETFVGKLSWRGHDPQAIIILRPPEPILVRERFDSLELWLFVQQLQGEPDTPATIELLFVDQQGRDRVYNLAELTWTGWGLAHKSVPVYRSADVSFPLYFSGLRFKHLDHLHPQTIYLNAMSAYMESTDSARYETRPSRGVPLRSGQSEGINQGADTLSLPVPDYRLLPVPSRTGSNHIQQTDEDVIELSWQSETNRLQYRINLNNGIGPIQILWNTSTIGWALDEFELNALPVQEGPPFVVRPQRNAVYIEYARGDVYQLSVDHMTLGIDVTHRGGSATGMQWEPFRSNYPLETVRVPSIPFPIHFVEADTERYFVSVFQDGYRSNASELHPIEGGSTYRAPVGDRPLDLHDRILITASRNISDVWPVPANPSSKHMNALGRLVWKSARPEADWSDELERARTLQSMGMNHVLFETTTNIWRESQGSYSLRLRANPDRGGNEALRDFLQEIHRLDWRVALYSNIQQISPLNEHWSHQAVLRAFNGQWHSYEAPYYTIDPLFALDWGLHHFRSLLDAYPYDALWLEGHAARPPWSYTGYDKRVPGAGTFTQAFYAYGDLMESHRRITQRPVILSGTYASIYAGIADAVLITDPLSWDPVGIGYAWRVLHPLAPYIGAGPYDLTNSTDTVLDRYIMKQIAYGHTGRLLDVLDRPDHAARSYFMMQALQDQYAGLVPEQISFYDGQQFLSLDQAMRAPDTSKDRMYLRFPNDLELWVNGSETESWTVRVRLETYVLPPASWLADAPDFFTLSAEVDGHRLDYVNGPNYTYIDGRGKAVRVKGLAASKPILIQDHPEDQNAVRVLNLNGNSAFEFESLRGRTSTALNITAYDHAGESVQDIVWQLDEDGFWQVTGPEDAYEYFIRFQ